MTTKSSRCPAQILPPRATIFIICKPQYINTADYGNTAVAGDDTSRQVGNLLVRKCKFCRCQMELDLTKGLPQVGFHFQVNVSLSVTKTCVPGKSKAKIFLSLFSKGQQRKAASSGFATKLNPFFLSFEHPGLAI